MILHRVARLLFDHAPRVQSGLVLAARRVVGELAIDDLVLGLLGGGAPRRRERDRDPRGA